MDVTLGNRYRARKKVQFSYGHTSDHCLILDQNITFRWERYLICLLLTAQLPPLQQCHLSRAWYRQSRGAMEGLDTFGRNEASLTTIQRGGWVLDHLVSDTSVRYLCCQHSCMHLRAIQGAGRSLSDIVMQEYHCVRYRLVGRLVFSTPRRGALVSIDVNRFTGDAFPSLQSQLCAYHSPCLEHELIAWTQLLRSLGTVRATIA